MARQHADTAVISEGHKEVVNIRAAGAASKCSAGNAIRIRILIRPNSPKPLFGTPLIPRIHTHIQMNYALFNPALETTIHRGRMSGGEMPRHQPKSTPLMTIPLYLPAKLVHVL